MSLLTKVTMLEKLIQSRMPVNETAGDGMNIARFVIKHYENEFKGNTEELISPDEKVTHADLDDFQNSSHKAYVRERNNVIKDLIDSANGWKD